MKRILILFFITLLYGGFFGNIHAFECNDFSEADSVQGSTLWISPVSEAVKLTDENRDSMLITISTLPSDAEILFDSLIVGRTPAKVPYLSKLTLRKKGFAEREIYPAMTDSVQYFELIRLSPANKESFFQTNTFTLVSAAIIVLGGTAAYLKIQADGHFEEYQRSGNDDFLSKTRRYDLYSGLAFGVMQINFGYLVYKFLVNP